MSTKTKPVSRFIVAIRDPEVDGNLVFPATVLANWFGTSVHFVGSDATSLESLQTMLQGVGVANKSASVVHAEDWQKDVAAVVSKDDHAVCVTSARDGIAMAVASGQATLVVPSSLARHRLNTGPLVVAVSQTVDDEDSVALAAVWALALEIGVRLAVSTDSRADSHLAPALSRLEQMGIESGVDYFGPDHIDSAEELALSRGATALVVPANAPMAAGLVERADKAGLMVLIAPPRPKNANRKSDEPSSSGFEAQVPEGMSALSASECVQHLRNAPIGRLAYVEDGWPAVSPVNFQLIDDDIVIRSLPGNKYSAARRGDVVCFEIDGIDDESRTGWTVIVHGKLEEITSPDDLRQAWDNDPDPWVRGTKWHWIRVAPIAMSGRKITAAPR